MVFETKGKNKEDERETGIGCSSPLSVTSERRSAYTISAGGGSLFGSSVLVHNPMCIDLFPMDFKHGQRKGQKQPACSPNASSERDEKASPISSQHDSTQTKKRPWRKPKDMPKRPLSAYNIFFADERKELLKAREKECSGITASRDTFSDSSMQPSESQGKKLGFAGLARTVAAKWKTLDAETKSKYEKQADIEKARYKVQMKEYNEQRLRAQQQAPMATNTDQTLSSPVWPAMPQTIASLGNIYDSTSEQSSQHSGLESFDRATAMGTSSGSASGLVMPKGSFYGQPQDSFPPAPAMGSIYPPADTLVFPRRLHQPEAKRLRRANSAGLSTNSAAVVHWNDDTALARRLSSPGNISILAAELGQDQVDFFLRSLRENQEEDEDDQH